MADLKELDTFGKRWERIWSSYYKRTERIARTWESLKRSWSSYYKRMASVDAFGKDQLNTLVIISVFVVLMALGTSENGRNAFGAAITSVF